MKIKVEAASPSVSLVSASPAFTMPSPNTIATPSPSLPTIDLTHSDSEDEEDNLFEPVSLAASVVLTPPTSYEEDVKPLNKPKNENGKRSESPATIQMKTRISVTLEILDSIWQILKRSSWKLMIQRQKSLKRSLFLDFAFLIC